MLLTGRDDKALAVEALNEGLIDLFLPKGQPGVEQRLGAAVRQLQRRYFTREAAFIADFLRHDDETLWGDPGLAALFEQICADRGVVEYYAVTDPVGFLLVYRDGRADLLLVLTEAEVQSHCVAAARLGAPAGVLLQMQARRSVCFVGDDLGTTVLDGRRWWDACTPLHPVPGSRGRFYALVSGPAPFVVARDSVLSFEGYLVADR